jgi:aspartate/methionine/tyrosine aminotransferase
LRRDFFYGSLEKSAAGVLTGVLPKGAFYAFLRIDPRWQSASPEKPASISWALAEHLITRGRIGCVPGADFGATGEGYIRFCFARDRRELGGALDSMRQVLAADSVARA